MKHIKINYLKIIFAVMTICLFASEGQAQSLGALYTVNNSNEDVGVHRIEKGTDLKLALNQFEQQYNVVFLYRSDVIEELKVSNIISMSGDLEKVLERMLSGTGLESMYLNPKTYGIYKKNEILREQLPFSEVIQEEVAGRVTDARSGEAIPGVNVVIDQTTTGTTTDVDGFFTLRVPSLQQTLVISYIGYVTQRIQIEGRTIVNIQLEPSVTGMGELVVVGYGTQRRSDLTGSISSIRREELQGQSVSNINQSLQGRIAGVDIRHSSGEPGAAMEIQIRGVGTFGNNDPLYVIDGVPAQSEDWTAINPADIESLEILKDASAAAIYGARAANGVVLVTTRSGSVGAPRFEYEASYGFQSFTDHENLLNSEQYAMLSLESAANDGRAPEPAFLDPQNIAHNSRWQEEAFQTAPMMNHNLSISGGTEKVRYMVSGNYFDQEGVFVHNWLKRYSTRINTTFILSDRLTIGQTLNLSRVGGLNRGSGHNLDYAYLLGGAPTMRIYRPENEGGYGGPNPQETGVNSRANVIGNRDLVRRYSYDNRLFGEVHANLKILHNLNYQFRVGLNASMNNSEQFTPTYNMDGRSVNRASMSETRGESHELLLENTLQYTSEIPGGHPFTLLAGYTQESSDQKFITAGINEFPSNDLRVIGAGTGDMTANGGRNEWALRSFFGRFNATLFDRYLLSATYRRDGSSRFGEANRWGDFPSFAVGWLVNRETFVPEITSINELKLRASWGQLGNQQIGDYVNQSLVQIDGIFYMFGNQAASGAAVTALGNNQLKWETTTQTDIGFDLEMFNNRLLFTVDYYMKNTEDILLRVPITVASGTGRGNGPFQNAASMKNSGIEFEVRYRENAGDFRYSISGNLSTVKNQVTSLGGESSIIDFAANVYGYGAYAYTSVGQPISSFYGWKFDGIFQNQEEIDNSPTQGNVKPGDVRFKDLNGDGVITDADRTVIGSPIPDFTYGFYANIGYRAFDLSLSVSGLQGRDIYNVNRAYLENVGMEWNQRTTVLGRWTGEGTSNTIPRATRNAAFSNGRPQDRFVEDGSYLRLQSLQIGYTLPSRLANPAGLRNLRLYLHGQNLFTLTGYSSWNPDIRGGSGTRNVNVGNPLVQGVDMGTYPLPRIVQLGVQVSF